MALALILLLVVTATAAAAPLSLSARDEIAPTSGHLSVLHDPSGRMTRDEVMARSEAFEPIPGTFNAGTAQKGAWWLRLTVEPEAGSGGLWLMQMSAPYTDYIDVYASDDAEGGQGPVAAKRTGSLVPLGEREIFSHLFVVRLDLREGQRQDIYIRMAGSRSLSAAPVLWRVSPFLSEVTFNLFTVAYIVGAASIMALGAVIFGVWLRSAAFAWYGAYLGCAALVILGNTGFATLLFHPLSPVVVVRMQGIWGCCAVAAAAFVVRAIFCADGHHPLLRRGITALGLLSAGYMVASAFGLYGAIAPYLHINLFLLCLTLPWLAAMRVRRGEPASWWYFVGFSVYALSGIWLTLMVLGVLPASPAGTSGYQIASIFTMVAVLVGLATSVRAGARERRDLQVEVLRASQRKERELEEAVAQRTHALEGEVEARRTAEGALIVALREQRHFLTMVSHEFRTPLAAIQVAIASLEPRVADMDAAVRREARRIARAARRMSHLIDAFLTEEVLDRRVMHLRRARTDVAALVMEICQDMAHQTGRDILAETHLADADRAILEADADLLRAAVENLVGNAVKYGGGPIRARLAQVGEGLSLAVTDSGPAIPETEQPFLFDRYFRGAGANSQSGLGIGLNIVQRIAAAHGGSVRVETVHGAGNTFTIWLPYAREDIIDQPGAGA
ncbi:sensor histidine kinase [Aquabacter spiritensis]|uniref:sensor histidine kinase n=1 Tax=Aquabacter spiritensis TaxID=933073 RepID=UPI001404AE05|nr:sensor histidine kinase [Aquabacter spiritensis]